MKAMEHEASFAGNRPLALAVFALVLSNRRGQAFVPLSGQGHADPSRMGASRPPGRCPILVDVGVVGQL
jgi:hypothetical protein